METYERRYDLINRKFKEFFLPTLFMSLAMNISTFVDGLIVSFTLGAINLSVIQVVLPIITFINLLYWMIGLGGSLLSSISKAEYKTEEANIYFTLSVLLLVIIGIIISAICFFNNDGVISILCHDPSIFSSAKGFLNFFLISFPFLSYMMCVSYFIRADGKPNLSFKAILIANIVNLLFDLIFILGFGMDVSGAALATSLGYIVGSIFISKYFFDKDRTLHFISVKKIKLSKILKYYKNIIYSGFPGASSQLFLTIKVLFFNTLIAIIGGASGLAAFSICYNSLYILYIFLIGTSQSMMPIVSVYNKEKDFSAVKHIVHNALKIVLISSFSLSILFIVDPGILLTLYSVKTGVDVDIITNAIRLFAISYMGTAITFLYIFYLQSIQKNIFSFLISLLQGLILPILFAYGLSQLWDLNGIWISFSFAEIITIFFILIVILILNKKSKNNTSGLLMIPKNKEGIVLDLTVGCNTKDIVNLSEKLIKFSEENGVNSKTSVLIGLAVEEMIINISNNNPDVKLVDLIVRINEEIVTISIKDEGKEFNPSCYDGEKYSFDNISVLQKISDDINYSRVIGLNSTVITIRK
ncbi:polysaccharide biosynthesis C-terminal domain-containing protein [Methanobrevibacter sp. OttesenSCG-928-K11]|nr:polysaccharide biosynthesis C-terminal domain-containing protein [Methanobrevibacter sp. OttesenSCG-928-K11]